MIKNAFRSKAFEKLVKNKFNVYSSLFLNLPYKNISNVGMLIPLLHQACEAGLKAGEEPLEIMNSFFNIHTKLNREKEKIDFMFRIIQYVERQVVLYDSVEDAAFIQLLSHDNHLSLKEYIHLLERNKNGDEIIGKLSSFSTRLVFTAHPTQFYPPSVLDIITQLRALIPENDINEIDIRLQQLGLTSLLNTKKPTPLDEAGNVIYFLRNVYYDAVGKLYSGIRNTMRVPDFDNPNIIQLGFWPGGDRDGNPFVTAEITAQVADELRMALMKCYYNEIKGLEQKMTFRAVEDTVADLRARLYVTMFNKHQLLTFEDIINPLLGVHKEIKENYNNLFIEDLENLIDKVKIFRTHFAILDIRQNHAVHKQTIEEILKKEHLISQSIDELEKEALLSLLLNNDYQVKADEFDDDLVKDTIMNITQLKDIQHKNGEAGCNRYIISNSEDIFSVLFVYALLRWCGWRDGNIHMDIVPLFESMEGMKNSAAIMQELFNIPEYRQHVSHRQETQTVMLGFSDGTKDGGYLQANWNIFQTKENLSEVFKINGIKAIFFDGRGGPPARGGGKTHRFYASQSRKIANHAIQLTVQGQTITSRYGSSEHFIHNCEQLITAGLSQKLHEKENAISEESRLIMEKLGQISFDKYTALKNHEKFISYLENKSTLKYYNEANIGSRPAKRGSSKKLELKDLRAIPFVGSWSQLKQNVPGYYGIGTALQFFVNGGKLDELKKLIKEVPYFKALILNSMMSLSKCNFDLTSYIAKDAEFKDFWNMLLEEYKLAKEMVLLISDYEVLMEEETTTKNSIQIREQIVLPLLLIQQYALQKIEQDSEFGDSYKKIVKRSLYGNINASRNSA